MMDQQLQKKFLDMMTTQLTHMRDDNLFTDVTIKCGNLTLYGHKVILSSHSSYFRAALSSDMKEARTSEVNLNKNLNPKVVKKIIDYMYTSEIDVTEDTEDVFKVAEYFEMLIISQMCSEAMLKSLTPNKFLSTWDIFEAHSRHKESELIIDLLVLQLEDLSTSEDFLNLTIDRVEILLTRSDFSKFGREALSALITWLKYDVPNRTEQVNKLLGKVKITGIPRCFLVELLENEPSVWHLPPLAQQIGSEVVRHFWKRIPSIHVIQYSAEENELRFQAFNVSAESWMEAYSVKCASAKPMNEVIQVFSYKTVVYFLFSLSLCSFNLESRIWIEYPALQTPCSKSARATCTGDRIYLIDSMIVQCLDLFNLTLGSWKKLAPLPLCPLTDPPVIINFNGRLLVIIQSFLDFSGLRQITALWYKNDQWVTIEHVFAQNNSNLSYCIKNSLYLMNSSTLQLFSFNLIEGKWKVSTILSTNNSAAKPCQFRIKCFYVNEECSKCYLVNDAGELRSYDISESQKELVCQDFTAVRPITSSLASSAFHKPLTFTTLNNKVCSFIKFQHAVVVDLRTPDLL